MRWYGAAAVVLMAATTGLQHDGSEMQVKKITAVLIVERIEPVLPFWERFGFERGAEVPHGDGLGFVILKHGATEVMYQTLASVAEDMPSMADTPLAGTALFIEVADIDEVEKRIGAATVVFPRRTTFYGATEIGLRDPAGNAVTFAQFK